jgi:cell division protein FtsZ
VIELDNGFDRGAKIRVVGVGGGGGNAVNSMIKKGLHGVDFFAVNTDVQALQRNQAPNKIQIGKNLTRGLGAGADPTIGYRAVEEDREEIARALTGSDMVFVTAGMGGGTGTGGAPLVGNIAKSLGALVVGIVTRPFQCEGKKRFGQAEQGIEELRKQVDTLIVIPNQKLLTIVERRTPLTEAFDIANSVLYGATRGISELITVPGLINVDFADVRTIMREMGDAVMGTGEASGENRAVEAAHMAISSPLLDDVSISGARGVLVNITGGPSMSLFEVDEATEIIHEAAGDEANVILGAVIDDTLTDEVIVTVIATGFNQKLAPPSALRATAPKPARQIERIPTGLDDLQLLDVPAYKRRGIELNLPSSHADQEPQKEKIDKSDHEKPAFLRKVMD